jgi:uncharacterized membrane protein SirB2
MDYATIKLIHMSAVVLSGLGFAARGLGLLRGATWPQSRPAKTLPHIVDTVLLASALTLAFMLHLRPTEAPWLMAKLVGLVFYIALGVVALKPRFSPTVRGTALGLGLLVLVWIGSVAVLKSPLGFLRILL